MARKFDGTKDRKAIGRPQTPKALTALVVKFPVENRTWGYDQIVGALENLGHRLSRQTLANILKRNGLEPAPERGRKTTWKDFIRSHTSVLAATDFFTAEVWTSRGLITYYVLFVLRVAQRRIQVVGITSVPNGLWMEQIARSLTLADVGFLSGCRYLLHDRDTKFTAAFDAILKAAGVEPVVLPPYSPNLNAYAERWVRSAKEECLSKLILFGEASLRHALSEFVRHFHHERNHQGKENVILFPEPADRIGVEIRGKSHPEKFGGCFASTIGKPHELFDPTGDPRSEFQRALTALGISHLVAPSPEAKGKIERRFGTFQKRLLALLAFERITRYDAAQVVLDHEAERAEPHYSAGPPATPLARASEQGPGRGP